MWPGFINFKGMWQYIRTKFRTESQLHSSTVHLLFYSIFSNVSKYTAIFPLIMIRLGSTVQDEASDSCSGEGDLVCGICECNHGRFGETCQCGSTGVDEHGNAFMCP